MSEQLYERLRETIAQHSAFFPPSTSRVELKFMRSSKDIEGTLSNQ